tara:strand:- start:23 stop:802 length:780 start_codon:yes stop_codon:yes gene_type:complete
MVPKAFTRFFACLLLLWAASPLAANTIEPDITSVNQPDAILFIGNSFTFYNGGIDYHLSELARADAQYSNPVTHRQAFGGETLQGHVQRRQSGEVIAQFPWDIVVIQGYSNEPLTHNERFERYAKELASASKAHGATPVFFMTWAYPGQPSMTQPLHDAYTAIANKTGAMVVPVGLAFAAAQKAFPDTSFFSDNKHSNALGTYLAACTFYAALYNKTVIENRYTMGLPEDMALALQRIATDTVDAFYQRGIRASTSVAN